jgi:hypothetical protein
MQHPAHPAQEAHRLKTTNPRIEKKYLSLLHSALQHNEIDKKLDDLYQTMQTSVLPTDLLKYEEIDEIITKSMQNAEKNVENYARG